MLTPLILASGAGHDPKDHVLPHALAPIFNSNLRLPIFSDQVREFWFTNHLLMTLVAAGIVLLIFLIVGQRYRAAMAGVNVTENVPRGFAGLVEGLMDALRSGVVKPVLGGDTDRFMPFLWTLFFFILVCNLLGMVPFDSIFKLLFGKEHLGGTATGNVNVTAGLALCAFFAIHVSGVFEVFRGLVAGTYGHHHDPAEGEEAHHGDERGHAHAVEHGHGHGRHGVSPIFAAVAAPVLYVWNFAPHVFVREGHRAKPGVALRILMVPFFAALIGAEMYGLFMMLGRGSAEVAQIGAYVGAALGAVAGLCGPGLHPLDWADGLMWAFLFLLEVVGALVKPFALCMRLFANMIAGHIVLASIMMLIPAFAGITLGYLGLSLPIVIGCTLLSCLELFVAFLQAYIFMFLTTMFISAAIHPEH